MVSLSRNYALHSATRIYPMEVLDVIRRDLLGSKGLALIRRRVLAWGVRNVVGPAVLPTWPAWVSLQLDGLLDYPEVSVVTMVHGCDRERLERMRRHEAQRMMQAAAVRALDQGMDPGEHHRLEIGNLPLDVPLALIRRLDGDVEAFTAWLREGENLKRFWHSVPGMDVLMTLTLRRNRNAQDKTHANDRRDISMLRVALPYANVVVAERSWAHFANSTGLAERYGTKVLGRLRDLPRALEVEGCVG